MIVPAYPVSALPFQGNSLLQAMNLWQTNKQFFKNSKKVHFSSCFQNENHFLVVIRNLKPNYRKIERETYSSPTLGWHLRLCRVFPLVPCRASEVHQTMNSFAASLETIFTGFQYLCVTVIQNLWADRIVLHQILP